MSDNTITVPITGKGPSTKRLREDYAVTQKRANWEAYILGDLLSVARERDRLIHVLQAIADDVPSGDCRARMMAVDFLSEHLGPTPSEPTPREK